MSTKKSPRCPGCEPHAYFCEGPFQYGNNGVCVHGWNRPHTLSEKEAQHSDHLTNCGLLRDNEGRLVRQRIEKIER
jgi:hypothetical protein